MGKHQQAALYPWEKRFHLRKEFMPEANPKELQIIIAGVIEKGEIQCFTVLPRFSPPTGKQRTKTGPVQVGHTGNMPQGASLTYPHEDGLRLIVGGMPEGHQRWARTPIQLRKQLREGLIPGFAGNGLYGFLTGRNSEFQGMKRKTEALGMPCNESGLRLATWTEAVIHMDDVGTKTPWSTQVCKRIQKSDRIRASATGHH